MLERRLRAASNRTAELFLFSGEDDVALRAQVAQVIDWMRADALSLSDLACNLAYAPMHSAQRFALTARTRESLVSALEEFSRGKVPVTAARGTGGKSGGAAWLFTGQGAQTVGMGKGLHAEWPAFREALDAAIAELDRHMDRPLRAVMWATPQSDQARLLDETRYAQAALFAVEWALAALWRSWGVAADYLLGHSIGEVVAACVAGVFSLGDGARLVGARGRLMQAVPERGAMIAVESPESEVVAALASAGSDVSVAAVNGPAAVVIAGREGPVLQLAESFAARGVRTKRLTVSNAFHSVLMDPMLEEFRRVAETVTYRAPTMPIVSNRTGALAGPELSTAEYWVSHVRETVRFAAGIKTLAAAGVETFVELGPKATLLGMVPECLPASSPRLFPSLRGSRPETESVFAALGGWHGYGGEADWPRVFPHGPTHLMRSFS